MQAFRLTAVCVKLRGTTVQRMPTHKDARLNLLKWHAAGPIRRCGTHFAFRWCDICLYLTSVSPFFPTDSDTDHRRVGSHLRVWLPGNKERGRDTLRNSGRGNWWQKKKTSMLLPSREEKSKQDGLIAFHRYNAIHSLLDMQFIYYSSSSGITVCTRVVRTSHGSARLILSLSFSGDQWGQSARG